MLDAMYPRDSLLVTYGESWNKGYARRLRGGDEAPARFTMRAGGTLQLHADFPLDEHRKLTLRAERISDDVSRSGG